MKNKLLFYFVGATLLVCSTGTFTSCVNGVDDEYLELVNNGGSGNSNEEDETAELPDLNGDYVAGGELELSMTYNGEELTGKAVNVAADEGNETATITFTGVEQDLTEMLGGLMEFKFTTFSPVPGVKEIILPNVKLYNSGTSYLFEGEVIEPTYTMTYKGTIEDGKMSIDLKHELANQRLVGTWLLADAVTSTTNDEVTRFSPLWFDFNSQVGVDLGKVSIINIVNKPVNGVLNILLGSLNTIIMNQIIGKRIHVQTIVKNMLHSLTTQSDGGMYAIYSWSGDIENPSWSGEDGMPHNALRYYFDPENPDARIYLLVDSKMLIDLIGGLINPEPAPAATRGGDPETTKEIGRQLIALLTPLLQEGIPCDYTLDETGSNMTLNIDGVVMRDLLAKIMELVNDEYAKPFVQEALAGVLGDFTGNIFQLFETLPPALKYYTYDRETGAGEGECGYFKVGLKLTKEN